MRIKTILALSSIGFSFMSYGQTIDTLQRNGYLNSHFNPGKVLFKTGAVENALLNYNTNTSAIAFDNDGKIMILTNPQDLDTVYIGEQKYIPVNDQFYGVESINNDLSLLIKYKNTLRPVEATADHSGTITTSSEEANNNANAASLLRKYKDNYRVVFTKQFFFKKADKNILYKADNEKQLLKLFPEKEAEIKAYLAANKVNFKDENDFKGLMAKILQ